MAIKKRPPLDPAREAKIEAFAAAADEPTATTVTQKPRPVAAAVVESTEKPKPKPMLLRLDADQHELLKLVAEREGRSMHNMAMTVLIPALEALRNEQHR